MQDKQQQQQQLNQEQLDQVAGGRADALASTLAAASDKLTPFGLADAESNPELVSQLASVLAANAGLAEQDQLALLKQTARAQGFEIADEAMIKIAKKT